MPEHTTTASRAAFQRACGLIPGGVDSPVRAFNAVGGEPLFVARAEGAYLWDLDGNRYIDFVGSWGPMLHGHSHPKVIEAISDAAARGTSYGAPCEAESDLAERLIQAVPSLERVRFVNSGTEATMSAIRVARGFTGRDVIIKFAGNYHGHGDCLLAEAGSGVATLGTPSSAGVPASVVADTWTAPYNDLEAVRALVEPARDRVAAIILEPIAGNMGLIEPLPGYLQGLRELCDEIGAVLIFDEVMSGFRVGEAGAQGLYGVTPDMTTLGKVIGGGLPVGAYGGREEIMRTVAPLGPVYQAGTLSGNPLAMAAGIATLDLIEETTFPRLAARGDQLMAGLQAAGEAAGVPVSTGGHASMRGFAFAEQSPRNYAEARAAATEHAERFARFYQGMLRRGVYLACSLYEACFISSAHTEDDIATACQAASEALVEASQ